jgi:hypothetical protein
MTAPRPGLTIEFYKVAQYPIYATSVTLRREAPMAAAKKSNITMTPELMRVIRKSVESGEFASTSEGSAASAPSGSTPYAPEFAGRDRVRKIAPSPCRFLALRGRPRFSV